MQLYYLSRRSYQNGPIRSSPVQFGDPGIQEEGVDLSSGPDGGVPEKSWGDPLQALLFRIKQAAFGEGYGNNRN